MFAESACSCNPSAVTPILVLEQQPRKRQTLSGRAQICPPQQIENPGESSRWCHRAQYGVTYQI